MEFHCKRSSSSGSLNFYADLRECHFWFSQRNPFDSIQTFYVWPFLVSTAAEGSLSGCIEIFSTLFSGLLTILTLPFSLFLCFKVVSEFERAVIFRMGRLRWLNLHILYDCRKFTEFNVRFVLSNAKLCIWNDRSGGARGPGVFFVLPCIDNYCKVDLRTVSFDVPPQEVLTKDSVTVSVDAVVYYRISDPLKAVIQV